MVLREEKQAIQRIRRKIGRGYLTMANEPIATLFYDKDKESYGLIYYEKYKNYEGLLPFNIDLS